ncbi:MAG: hypothetical protein M1365_12565 [Actinobacteria bacterium]|nr:hypothetical protein [Actinomycetota bacterium]
MITITRYVNRIQIIGMTEYRLTLVDLIEGSEVEPQKRSEHQDTLFVRDIPITIQIPEPIRGGTK